MHKGDMAAWLAFAYSLVITLAAVFLPNVGQNLIVTGGVSSLVLLGVPTLIALATAVATYSTQVFLIRLIGSLLLLIDVTWGVSLLGLFFIPAFALVFLSTVQSRDRGAVTPE